MPTVPIERPPLAYDQLLERCLGNVEFAERILARFLSKFDEDFARLEEGVAAGNEQAVASTAHRLKGSSANVAAADLARVMSEIEQLGRQGDWTQIAARLDEVRREWTRLAAHAKGLVRPPSGA
jgi:HPt (histidine-containing phosphotransfer) domain-containing protein